MPPSLRPRRPASPPLAPAAPPRRRLQGTGSLHANVAQEHDAAAVAPVLPPPPPAPAPASAPPTSPPPSLAPSVAATAHPTLARVAWMVKGSVWYDRNANGVRDAGVAVTGVGDDVEFSHGLGGVGLQLLPCDAATGRAPADQEGEALPSFAGATSHGKDALGRALIVPMGDMNGKFQLHLAQGHLGAGHYYIQAQVPTNAESPFLFTAGICNDDQPGWECADPARPRPSLSWAGNATARPLGIPTGRSPGCVFVDDEGRVERLVDFGVMREGDTKTVDTGIALILKFNGAGMGPTTAGGRRARRHLLAAREKLAVGTVAAEVLAAALDARLAAAGAELDAVDPQDVFLSQAADGGDELAVVLKIRGHYSPPPELDFDYIVQESINRDTAAIRRGLREHNEHCREQRAQMRNGGHREEDFRAVASASGARHGQEGRGGALDAVFSTACAADLLVPASFETSLKEVGTRDVADLRPSVVYVQREYAGALAQWAIGPVAGLAGLIVLLAGLFVFRRALGSRRADGSSFSGKIKEIDDSETSLFDEAGGDMDDGSSDSAFSSESDSDEEETEKERRMRRRRKAKAQEQRESSRKGKADEPRKRKDKTHEQRGAGRSDGDVRPAQAEADGDGRTRRKKGRAKRAVTASVKKSFSRAVLTASATKSRARGAATGRSGKDARPAEADGDGRPRRKKERAKRAVTSSVKKSFSRVVLTASATKSRARDAATGSRAQKGRRRTANGRMEGKLLAASQGSDDTGESSSRSSRRGEKEAKMQNGDGGDGSKPAARGSSGKERVTSDRRERKRRSKRNGGDRAKPSDESSIV